MYFLKFRYSDNLDKLLIVVGSVASVTTGGIYSILNILIGNLFGVLISFENSKSNQTVLWNATSLENKW
jgi:hypothetical protein